MDLKKGTVIECVASTSDNDVVGESLDVNGADISPLLEGRGFCNVDHRNDFAHLVGKVQDAKIIKSLGDCSTPSQIKFWDELKKPFIWTKAEIYDGHGHKEADSIASIYKFYQAKGEAPPIKVSVEGKTLERDGNSLKRTLIKGIALTVAPCNRKTRTEVVAITKSNGGNPNTLVKSEDSAFVPMFIEMKDEPVQKLYQLAVTARELLRDVRMQFTKSEQKVELRSPALLERAKQMKASLIKKTRKN